MPVLRRNFLVPAYDTRQEKLEDKALVVTGLVLQCPLWTRYFDRSSQEQQVSILPASVC
jgi:hypothetical protein